MDIQTFVKTYTGQVVNNGQCVLLFWRFNLDCGNGESYSAPGAYNLWTTTGGHPYIWDTYERITGTLRYGDWCIWSGFTGAYQNGGAGHVAMFLSDNGDGTAQFFTQNPGPARVATLSLSGVVGALRSKLAKTAPAPAAAAGVAVLRTVGKNGAHYRDAPNTGGRILQTFAPGTKTYWKGYVVGADPYGTGDNAWLVGAFTGHYAWASGFTPDSIAGLPRL